MESIIMALASLLGGGALATIITTLINKKKTDAEAKNTNIQSILDIDARMNERLVRLEERVAHLEEENIKLKEENMKLKSEINNH